MTASVMAPSRSEAEAEWRTLCANIRLHLKRLGLDEQQASTEAGLGPTFIRDILLGRSRSPRTGNLRRLAGFFGLSSVDDLYLTVAPAVVPRPEPVPSGEIRVPFLVLDSATGAVKATGQTVEVGRSIVQDAEVEVAALAAYDVAADNVAADVSRGDIALIDRAARIIDRRGKYLIHDGRQLEVYLCQPVPGSGGRRVRLWWGASAEPTEAEVAKLQVVGRMVVSFRRH